MSRDQRSERIPRRSYLKFAGGAAATAAIAGCLGGDGGDGEPVDDDGGDDGEPMDDDGGNGDGGDGDGSSIVVTQGQMASTMDPHNHRETPTDNVLMHVYERVLYRNPEGEIVENIGTDWERVEEGLVRVELRDDVSFHNGDDLTPEDVAFSIRRVVDGDVGNLESPQRDQLAGIVDAAAAEDGHAVEIESEGINPMVFANLASYGQIVQEDWIMEREPEDVAQDAMGTGPYELEEYVEDEHADFTAFDDYWGDGAAIEGVRFNNASEDSTRVGRLLAQESHVVESVPPDDAPRVEDDENARIESVPSTRVLFMPMRNDVEPFTSREFRQAMNYAIDLDEIIEQILRGFGDPTGQPTLEGYVGYNEDVDPYPYDPNQAEQLVEDSGFAGASIELHGPVGRYLKDVEIADAVAGYIDELPNVTCEYVQRDFQSLAGELLDGDMTTSPAFFMIGWGNTTFDASQTLIPWFREGAPIQHFQDEEADQLLAESQTEGDEEAREGILQEVNAHLYEEAPWVFLNRQYSVYGLNESLQWEPRQDELIAAYEMTFE